MIHISLGDSWLAHTHWIGNQGSGSCRRKSDTWLIYINWMHRVKETEDGGKERV